MSVAKVLKLQEYRDRRQHRLELRRALNRMDPGRYELIGHLGDIVRESGADRVAVAWVDEYGPGLVHPYVVLDMLSDTPRRHFPIEPLRKAWEIGVPGAYDDVGGGGGNGPTTFAISLGSDGARAWFVIADSVGLRSALESAARDRIMFIAGECSAIALHQDLDSHDADVEGGEARFAGWPVLRDLEGVDESDPEAARIAARFAVARVVRMLVGDDLVMGEERLAELVRGARAELDSAAELPAEEARRWTEVLDLLERGRVQELSEKLLHLADAAEAREHVYAAEELYLCAYGSAAAVGEAGTTANAARLLGRLHRRRARREEATAWYETAHRIASIAKRDDIAALSLSGLGNTRWELGNIPGAREVMRDALELAERSKSAETLSTIHRAIASVEAHAGETEAALTHGWKAVTASETERDRTRGLATLASMLEWAGDLEVASTAWAVVAERTTEHYLQVMALDAVGHLAARLGDATRFEEYAARADAVGHEALRNAHVQILYYRGLSFRALGRYTEAEQWLARAVDFAQEHSFNEWLFKAENDLAGLADHAAEAESPTPAAPPFVRDGVEAMRQELATAGA